MGWRDKYGADAPGQRPRPGAHFLFSHPAHLIALFFGAGCLRPGPGTWGSLAAVLLWPALAAALPTAALVGLTLLTIAVGAWASEVSGRHLGVADPGCVVIDEVAAVWSLCLLVRPGWFPWLAAFLAFRCCDILKPPPVSWVDRRWHGGVGVMLDDLLAALWAGLILLALDWLSARLGPGPLGIF